MMKGGRRLRDGRVVLVGRDPRDPRLLRRVLGDPERERQPSAARVSRRQRHHLARAPPRHLPRGDDPTVGAALQAAHHHRELLLRIAALHRHDLGRGVVVPHVQRRLPALSQHARDHDRARAHRLHLLPAHAASVARLRPVHRAASPAAAPRLRRHPRQVSDVLVVRLRARPRASRTSTRPCRACTSRGPRGARWRSCRA